MKPPDLIKVNYSKINYKLFSMALSNENSEIFLIITCLNNDGKATHSKISASRVDVDGLRTLSCQPVKVARFDSLDLADSIAENFLLKVDVDGQDLNVIKGFGKKLSMASAIIIECTYVSMIERISFIQSMGFTIVDLVDIVYFGESLYQFDAVFVRKDLVSAKLRPPISEFKAELWRPLQFR